MDLDKARKLLGSPLAPVRDVLIELLDLIGRMDDRIARLEKRLEEVERSNATPR
jgi:hypothetical protein